MHGKEISYFEDLFYRCRFQQLLTELDSLEITEPDTLRQASYALIKAGALYEMHQVNAAKDILKSLKQNPESEAQSGDAYLYAQGRLCYMEQEFAQARMIFEELVRRSDDPRFKFRGKLGIANTLWDEGLTKDENAYKKIPAVIEELCGFEPLNRDDDKISLLIFLGNYYLNSGSSSELASKYFKKAMNVAAVLGWNYFITRALHGLAHVAKSEGNYAELLWTLDVLRAFVNESESLSFSYLVNRDFQQYFSINTAIEFDGENKRILLKDKWLAFHDKPMLFRFLELLHAKDQFVPKSDIAEDLWPNEEYKPRVHDPRIFDIAKRARSMIETYDSRPVVLLSGRLGYKLASN